MYDAECTMYMHIYVFVRYDYLTLMSFPKFLDEHVLFYIAIKVHALTTTFIFVY